MKQQAVFLDRDGTLIEEVGYLRALEDLRLCAGAADAVRRINAAGWLAIVLTSQSGIARGLFTEAFLHEAHRELRRQLAAEGAHLDAIYYCPHLPPDEDKPGDETLARYRIDCDCRKPRPGLIARAAAELEIDVGRSYVIGDRYRDVEAGHNAGTLGALVLTGYGRAEYAQRTQWLRQPDLIGENVLEAVQIILGRKPEV